MNKEEVINSLKEKLELATTGDQVREVIFLCLDYGLTQMEIESILGSVHKTNEEWKAIEESDRRSK